MSLTHWQRVLVLLRHARAAAKAKGEAAKAARIQAAIDADKAIPKPKPPPPPPPPHPVVRFPAIIAARTQSQNGPQFGEGECLMRVHDCYGIGALFPTAAAGWKGAAKKHPTADPNAVPRGYPVWWTGGSKGFGHVAIAAGRGMCWSTDIQRVGFFDLVPIAEIHDSWGLTLVGWSEDLNGQTVVAST